LSPKGTLPRTEARLVAQPPGGVGDEEGATIGGGVTIVTAVVLSLSPGPPPLQPDSNRTTNRTGIINNSFTLIIIFIFLSAL
jgi:hypothetical protein